MWERAFRLLPSFVLPIACNQLPYVSIGEDLNILMQSRDILSPNFSFSSAFDKMYRGTHEFRTNVLNASAQGYGESR